MRADAFAAVGGFDAGRYPRPSIEDIELGGRLAATGRILLDRPIQGTHLKEWTLGSMIATDFARRGVPWVRLMAERREVPATAESRPTRARERGAALSPQLARGGPTPVPAAVAHARSRSTAISTAIARRLGARGLVAAVPLHVLHQLVAVAAVPAGVAASLSRP